MSPISTRRIAALVVVGMAMLLVPAAGASAAPFTVNPNPVNFNAAPGDTSLRNVIVTNNGTRTVDIRRFILSGSAAGFHVVGDLCPHVAPGGRCGFRVTYTASSNPAADHGTLRVEDEQRPFIRVDVPLNGTSGGGSGDTTPPNCTLAAKRHQQLVVRLRRRHGRRIVVVTVHNRFNVGVTSSEDGTVSALASGSDSHHKAISLKVASARATAGNGVGLKLRMDSTSERRLLSDIHAGHTPRMTLRANCIDEAGNARQVTAVVRFTENKRRRVFVLPLFADPTAR